MILTSGDIEERRMGRTPVERETDREGSRVSHFYKTKTKDSGDVGSLHGTSENKKGRGAEGRAPRLLPFRFWVGESPRRSRPFRVPTEPHSPPYPYPTPGPVT